MAREDDFSAVRRPVRPFGAAAHELAEVVTEVRQLVDVGAVGLDGEDLEMLVRVLADPGLVGKQSVRGPERRIRARGDERRRRDGKNCREPADSASPIWSLDSDELGGLLRSHRPSDSSFRQP